MCAYLHVFLNLFLHDDDAHDNDDFFQSRKAQQPAGWECQMPDFSIEHAPHPSVEPIGLLGPYWVKGTLTWEDHEWILKETGCSASIRKVRDSAYQIVQTKPTAGQQKPCVEGSHEVHQIHGH